MYLVVRLNMVFTVGDILSPGESIGIAVSGVVTATVTIIIIMWMKKRKEKKAVTNNGYEGTVVVFP